MQVQKVSQYNFVLEYKERDPDADLGTMRCLRGDFQYVTIVNILEVFMYCSKECHLRCCKGF